MISPSSASAVISSSGGRDALEQANGELGLEAFRREPFDLVLMDVMISDVDGYQAVTEIRNRGRWPIPGPRPRPGPSSRTPDHPRACAPPHSSLTRTLDIPLAPARPIGTCRLRRFSQRVMHAPLANRKYRRRGQFSRRPATKPGLRKRGRPSR